MKTLAFEGVVKRGVIRLEADIELPDNTPVFVLVPGDQAHDRIAPEASVSNICSPRLATPADYNELRKTVIQDAGD